MSKVKLSTEWLSVCGGCHVAIVDLHELILKVLESVEILHCPVLTDIKDYPKADLGIITGAIRNHHEKEMALKMRESCKAVIAFGTCAVFGGISGAGFVHGNDEILKRVYQESPSTSSKNIPCKDISPLQEIVAPLDSVIDVDLYLPGCPPHPKYIFDALLALLQGRPPHITRHTVCAECNRQMKKTDVKQIRRDTDGIPDEETCLLSQGYICFGSVTQERCLSPCPTNGVTCLGCAGPNWNILNEPNRDIRTELATRMSRLTAIPEGDIMKHVERFSKTYYAFAMSSPQIGGKPTFLIKKWIREMEI